MYVYTDLLEGSVGLKPLAAVRGYASAKLLGVSRAWLFEPLPKKYILSTLGRPGLLTFDLDSSGRSRTEGDFFFSKTSLSRRFQYVMRFPYAFIKVHSDSDPE